MATFTWNEVILATCGVASQVDESIIFESVSTDTRTITANCLFVALEGERFDGHDYIMEAAQKGAIGAIVSKSVSHSPIPLIQVNSTLKAYQSLASYHRQRFSIPLVAITGSSGKTTTKELIGDVLGAQYNVLKTEKNYNNEVGLPKTLLNLDETHDVCVVEMGMRGIGQIAELAEIAKPTIGVITNVGTSHIEILGSQEQIGYAKSELVKSLPKSGYAILNEDDSFVKRMSTLTSGKIIGYGIHTPSTVTAYDLRYKKDGIKFTCRWYDETFDVFLPMIGVHNVYDALAAIAVARVLGVSSSKIRKALGDFPGIPMRQEIRNWGDFVTINDSYNANPASMEEAIVSMGQLEGKRKVAILGDMLELGEFSEEAHRSIGALLAKENFSVVYTYGNESKYIAEEAKAGGISMVFDSFTKEAIAAHYLQTKQEGDVILFKGSRGLGMETILDTLTRLLQGV